MTDFIARAQAAPDKPVRTAKTLRGVYTGTGFELFGLALGTALLSVLTLGLYRFWARTRIRRFIWSSTYVGDDGFQYTGTGLEKLLGFLIAVVILAVVLSGLQLGLFFLNLSLFSPRSTEFDLQLQIAAAQGSLLLLGPLFYIARYRALRYKLSRTRWRGLRFAMEKGAFGYALRAVGHTILSVLTLGLLFPRQTYKLAKYRIDRTWYGNTRFTLEGRWTALYSSMAHLFIAAILVVVGVVCAATETEVLGMILMGAGYLWFFFGTIHYKVDSFAKLAEMTRLGGEVTFEAEPRSGTVFGKVFFGSLAMSIIVGIVLFAFLLVAGMLIGIGVNYKAIDPSSLGQMGSATGIVIVAMVLLQIAFYSALGLVLITQPIIAHVVSTFTLRNGDALDAVRQRGEDDQVDADGLADALDFGGAF